MMSMSTSIESMPQPVIALLSQTIAMDHVAAALKIAMPEAQVRFCDINHSREDLGHLADITLAVCWQPPEGLLAQMPNLRLIQSLAAGVDHIVTDPSLPDVPLCRIVDPHMASGMAAYVVWAVTHQHRHMGAYLRNDLEGKWAMEPVTPASQYQVGVAGLGALGLHCAKALAAIGYPVRGWSRTPKNDLPSGVTGYAGEQNLQAFLTGLDALICLLPLTTATEGFLCEKTFTPLAKGAHLINVGRGEQQVEADILAALDQGQLGFATLDVFEQEPLPAEHPFWRHPQVFVSPHIATRTAPAVIAAQTSSNYAAVLQGLPLANSVDISRGY